MKKKPSEQQASISLPTELSTMLEELRAAWDSTGKQQKTTVSKIILKTYGLFNKISGKRSQEHLPLLKACALIGAECPAIDDMRTFEFAFRMQINYLIHSPADDEFFMPACTAMRDRFYEKIPNLQKRSRPGVLSVIFGTISDIQKLRETNWQELPDDYGDISTVLNKVTDRRQVSFLDLQNKVEALKNQINQKKTISKNKWVALFEDLYAYTSGLKQEYPLEKTVIDSVTHPVKVALEYMIELQNTLILYMKTSQNFPFHWLESALKRKAMLLNTLSNYYQKATEAISQTEKDKVSSDRDQVEAESFDIKNIIVWNIIIDSPNTSDTEKNLAHIAIQQQLSLHTIPIPKMPSEGEIFDYYETLKAHFNSLMTSSYWLWFEPLQRQLAIYLQECFRHYSKDSSLHIRHIDGFVFDNDDFELSPESCESIFEHKTKLWNILSLYYEVSIKNYEQLGQYYSKANNPAFQKWIQDKLFICNARHDCYRCVFEDDTGSLEERYKKFCYLYQEQDYAPSLLRELAKRQLESCENVFQAQAVSEKDQNLSTPEVTIEVTHEDQPNPKQQKDKKSLRKKEEKEQKKRNRKQKEADDAQFLKESRVYAEKQLIFRPAWTACRTDIFAQLKNKNLEVALTMIDNALNDAQLLDNKERCDALILKGAVLNERIRSNNNDVELSALINVLSPVINKAWQILASNETPLLSYMQQETLNHYRHQIYTMQQDKIQTISWSVCQNNAEKVGTFCFPLLFSNLRSLSNNDAIQTYKEPVMRLLNTHTQLVVNEYHVTEFIMFYHNMSARYYEQGKLLWLESNRYRLFRSQTKELKANESPTDYFTQSILILERLIDYAKYYQPESVFDLTLSLIKLHKSIAEFTELEDALRHKCKANNLIGQALQSLPQETDQEPNLKMQELLSALLKTSDDSNKKIIDNNRAPIDYMSTMKKFDEKLNDRNKLKHKDSIIDLQKIFEEEIQLRILDTYICLAIKVINHFYPNLRNLTRKNKANELAFNEYLTLLYEKSTQSLSIAHINCIQKIAQLKEIPCDNSLAPSDALVHEHNVTMNHFLLVKFMDNLTKVRKKLGMRTTDTDPEEQSKKLYLRISENLQNLTAEINNFSQPNTTVKQLTILECNKIHMEKVTIKNPNFFEDNKDKDIILVQLNKILEIQKNNLDQKTAFKAAEIMFWTLETIEMRLYPIIDSHEAKQFLTFLQPHYRKIATDFYQIACNSKSHRSQCGFLSNNDEILNYIREQKRKLKAPTLTSPNRPNPEILNDQEEQKQFDADTPYAPGSLGL